MPRKNASAASRSHGLLPPVPVQFVEMLADLLNTLPRGKHEPSAEARAHVKRSTIVAPRMRRTVKSEHGTTRGALA